MPQLKVQNLYNTTVTEAGGIPASGDCDFTVAVAPENTNGFIIISPENPILREIMYYHNVSGNRIYVRKENRFSPKAHSVTESVKMNDVAEIFNTFSDMISQAFYVEKTGGLTVRVWGGYVYYNGSPVSVPDTNLTMNDNTTNYIKYDYPSNTFSVDTVNSGNIKAHVITLGGAITSIGYRTAKESYIDFTVALTGALPSQSGNAGKALVTDGINVSWGYLNNLRTGFGIDKHVRINRTTGLEEVKNVTDGSTLLPTDKIRVEKAFLDYEDIPFSVFSSALSPSSLTWNPSAVIAQILAVNDAVALQDIPTSTETQLGWQNVGDVAGNSIITMYAYSTGVSSNTLKLRTDKVSPTQNFAVRIVTTSGGVATTTQVDTNAIQSIAPASVTAGGELTITFPGSFSCGARGTKIAIQVCQGTFASPVTGANYYKVGYGIGSPISSHSQNVTSTCTVGTFQGGMTSTWAFNFTTNRVMKFLTLVTNGTAVPSGTTITITVGGVQALQFVTSGASSTITIPNGGLMIGSGKAVVVSTSLYNSAYWTMNAVTTADITTIAQNTPFNIVTSTGYAEYNMTSTLIENITAQKLICALLSTRHRLGGFTAGGGAVSSITSTLSREGVLGGFSGLTRDSTYYLSDTAGLISLTSSSPAQKAGVALSTTELDIKTRYTF